MSRGAVLSAGLLAVALLDSCASDGRDSSSTSSSDTASAVDGCSRPWAREEDPRSGGSGARADIAIHLDRNANSAMVDEVAGLFLRPSGQAGGGEVFVDGIFAAYNDYHEPAVFLQLRPGTTEERCDELAAVGAASPLIEDVELDAIQP
jgi:hypothetical protein